MKNGVCLHNATTSRIREVGRAREGLEQGTGMARCTDYRQL